jgi:3-isopropylmalate/(R)-2-methylmalate dehydratase small subunit
MEKFTKLSAIAAPIMRQNIDTDMVIRVERLRDLPPDKLGPYAFESWRYKPDGKEAPEFVLNRPPFRDARIILAADNFGCGSSRDAAVWSLFSFGIRCVIAPSFGPIFYNNCFQNGLLPVALPLPVIEELVAEVEASQGTGKV